VTDSLVESVGVPDETVDRELAEYLRLERPTSFFLFAGAGTGKTRSLVTALQSVADKDGPYLRMRGQRIAVITYTNAACDEIVRRVRFTPLVAVSTIHSFLWEQIRGFNSDIRCWIRANVASDISELQELIRKGRQGTKTYEERIRSVESKQRRLDTLDSIKQFIYSPTGDNRGRDSLNHSEVITIGADFLSSKPLMRQLLVSRYPILLIDESQDTNKLLMESVLTVQRESPVKFALGLFGDTMQRIYADGKVDLGRDKP